MAEVTAIKSVTEIVKPVEIDKACEGADVEADVQVGTNKVKLHFNIFYIVLSLILFVVFVAGALYVLSITGVLDDIRDIIKVHSNKGVK